ncbi:MAG: hypothetical protein JO235_09330 [Chroococcidiopsidaceae cyanobacterium CP_BM_RX_35]|nr:hypothetical protein [Chroococcidiopsidaceae cyanobacterium CP_BM_RX_35]
MTLTEEILRELPGDILERLRSADRLLSSLREKTTAIPQVIKQSQLPLGVVDCDVVVAGGTLGILIGCALAQLGWRVVLLERGILRGREQEWNISRPELEVFVELNLLSAAELEQVIATQYNPARVSFLDGPELWVQDILNIGVDPVFLLETLKRRFLEVGGCLVEQTPFEGVVVHPDGVMVEAGDGFKTRLLLDVMGHFSPIAQ